MVITEHDVRESDKTGKKVICDECGVHLMSKKNYSKRKYITRVYGIGATKEMPRTNCSECRGSFETQVHAREHIATEHIIDIADKYYLFKEVVKLVDGFITFQINKPRNHRYKLIEFIYNYDYNLQNDCNFAVDLLLLVNSDDNYHYVFIEDLCKMVIFVRKHSIRERNEICRKFFSYLHFQRNYQKSSRNVLYYGNTNYKDAKTLKSQEVFKSLMARWFAPRLIYFDLESIFALFRNLLVIQLFRIPQQWSFINQAGMD